MFAYWAMLGTQVVSYKAKNALRRQTLLLILADAPIGPYHPLDGVTNLKYKLWCFFTPNKKNFIEKGTSF